MVVEEEDGIFQLLLPQRRDQRRALLWCWDGHKRITNWLPNQLKTNTTKWSKSKEIKIAVSPCRIPANISRHATSTMPAWLLGDPIHGQVELLL